MLLVKKANEWGQTNENGWVNPLVFIRLPPFVCQKPGFPVARLIGCLKMKFGPSSSSSFSSSSSIFAGDFEDEDDDENEEDAVIVEFSDTLALKNSFGEKCGVPATQSRHPATQTTTLTTHPPSSENLNAFELLRAEGHEADYRNAAVLKYDEYHIEDGFIEMRSFTPKSVSVPDPSGR